MRHLSHLVITTTLVLFSALFMNVRAQTAAIEVITDNERAQFSTSGQAMHVEIFSPSGELVFERDSIAGQSVQWRMVNDQGERVADGVYLATITVTDLSGKRRKRVEQIIVSRETQPEEVLSDNASITGAVVRPITSDASKQTVSLSGNRVSPILSVSDVRGAPFSARDAINTTMRYNHVGTPAFGVEGPSNTFYGQGAGVANTRGGSNSFVGAGAGQRNTMGSNNSFFGWLAGTSNLTASGNSFFGAHTGFANTNGTRNSFFGWAAGDSNTDGNDNSFFGQDAGQANTTGNRNSFFGAGAGDLNNGTDNSFFGQGAGQANTTGGSNSFFGRGAGQKNTLSSSNSFFGTEAGDSNTTGNDNSFFGRDAGASNTIGGGNTFIGLRAGDENTSGNNNTYIGNNASGSSALTNATAIGANANVTQSNSLVLGSINGVNNATADTNVGIGILTPQSRLHIGNGYLQLHFVTSAPAPGDCTVATAGRMVVFANGTSGAQLYICDSDRSPVLGNQPGWIIK